MFRFFKRKKKKEEIAETPTITKKNQPILHEETIVAKEDPKVQLSTDEEISKPRKMAYHITKHPQGGWQIKKGKAQRALKRFETQKEAIDYAKELEKTGASYVIHKADGKTRKKTY